MDRQDDGSLWLVCNSTFGCGFSRDFDFVGFGHDRGGWFFSVRLHIVSLKGLKCGVEQRWKGELFNANSLWKFAAQIETPKHGKKLNSTRGR
jgi:hypothetical protein